MNTHADLRAPDPTPRDVADLVTRLTRRLRRARADVARGARSAQPRRRAGRRRRCPDVVVFPHTNEEVAAIVRLCHAARVPVIAFGVGTSLEGHVAALYGGVCVDLSQMNRVLEVNAEDLDCRVQAGVRASSSTPSSRAPASSSRSIRAPTRRSAAWRRRARRAPTPVRYGTMRENVLGLTVVTPDGRIIRTGGRVAEVERRLRSHAPLTSAPKARSASSPRSSCGSTACPRRSPPASASSTTLEARCRRSSWRCSTGSRSRASSSWTTCRWTRASATRSSRASRRSRRCSSNSTAARRASREQVAQMQAITDEFGGSAFEWATKPEDRSRLWKARHAAYYAAKALSPGQAGVRDRRLRADLAPRRLRARDQGRRRCNRARRARSSAMSATATSTCCVLFDPDDAGERERAEELAEAHQPARDRDGRHLHRRARHRRAQARRARRRARRGGRPRCARSSARSIRATS